MRVSTAVWILAFVIGAASQSASAGPPALDAALASHYKSDAAPAYEYALVDLNGDGVLGAVVLMTDRDFCGSGGCNMNILRGSGQAFAFVSASSVSRAPIRLLTPAHKGWRSLSVTVSGGGARPREALMKFDGKRYPANPSTQPHATKQDLAGSGELQLEK